MDSSKDVFVIKLKMGLLMADCLGLEIDYQQLFAPYAGHHIYLCDSDGNKVRCRVNVRVTMLKGKGLAIFLSRLGTTKISVREQKPGQYLVKPLKQEKTTVPSTVNAKEKSASAKQPKDSTRMVKTVGTNRRNRRKTPVGIPEMIAKTSTATGEIDINNSVATANRGIKMPRSEKTLSIPANNISLPEDQAPPAGEHAVNEPGNRENTADLKRLVQEVMVRNRRSETGAIVCRRRAEVIEVTLSQAEKAFYHRLTTFVRGLLHPGCR